MFPNIVNDEDIDDLESEWRFLIINDFLPKDEDLENFWTSVFKLKTSIGELMYPHIQKLISALLSLPHSSASSERVFSLTSLIKNKIRNRLSVSTVCSVMLIKQSATEEHLKDWVPSKDLLSKYNKSHA